MFLNEERKVNLTGAILLFSCFFCAVFATVQLSPISTQQPINSVPFNTHGSKVSAINDANSKLSAEQRFMRDLPPSAYGVRIQGCTDFMTKTPTVQKYETRPFSVGGFNWTFTLEPFGSSTDLGTWISGYVTIDPSGLVGENREVYADIRFLVYSKTLYKYFSSMDTDLKRFNQSKTTWGNPNFIRHVDLKDANREYIFDNDNCVFGVDIFVYPLLKEYEVMSIDKTDYGPQSWKLRHFSTLTKDFYISDEFSIGGQKLAFKVYPNGNGAGVGNSLSLYVILSENQTLKPYEKVYVQAKLRVLDQKQSNHHEKPILTWLAAGENAGFDQFVSLSDLQNPAKGFIVDDSLVVQVQFEGVSSTYYHSSNAAQFLSTF